MAKIGDRVGAIQMANDKTVFLFGYGVYDGDVLNEELGYSNPRITLDSGQQVWGFESWWGPEDKIKSVIGDREVVIVER